MDYKFIAIEGNIGAGKTSLANMLAKDIDASLLLEKFNDNPFLPKFYKEPDQYAFPLELSFLAERYNQIKPFLLKQGLIRPYTISDYYLYKSLIFAKANLKEDEYKLYRQLFDIIHEKFPKPDILIYLHLNIQNLLGNIQKRGRTYEQNISGDYLLKIQNTYFSYFRANLPFPILMIDMNNIDFVSEENDYQWIKNLLKNNYSKGLHAILRK
ncbi:MAG: deoxynucleoside kinase [Bacteroidetes bacterium]|nr:deoxynucleoside kinase [Bacteroidota bacterium]